MVPRVAPVYDYVEINEATPPEVLFFDGIALTNDSRVYGTAFTEIFDEAPYFTSYLAVFEHGVLTLLQGSKGNVFATTANEGDTIGGLVTTDFENGFGQAALFDGNKVQLIPLLPGEIHNE